MRLYSKRIIYPEGDDQEINHPLSINQLVDINGIPLQLPLRTTRIIAYRVYRISTESNIGEEITSYHLELIWEQELRELLA
ncbi:MAG: hypothetical protein GH155_02950 [Spirochaeta sp.]|nr:hypothetical protein [Spirochaeta sp.]